MSTDPATESGPRRPRPPGTIRIGQIAGVDVLVTTSWFLIAALISIVLAPLVEETQPGLGGWKYVAGVAFAVLLYLSVLLHEASHAIAAQRFGHSVDSITLHFLGGATAIEGSRGRHARSSGSRSSVHSPPCSSAWWCCHCGGSRPMGCCRWRCSASSGPMSSWACST
ncbi:hypothetical protein [Nocardioides alcanivorans]|uniref:hypothetical protein n=1 Tax=Nocardioides alcanivorans TaxID=2897352 RepID=UPI001F44CE36|nr:hypothetical protein [Nocardioides alcanivorans]